MIDGPTPLYLIESPTPGTGKSLLAKVVCQATTGSEAAAMTVGRDEEEIRKRITSVLSCSQPVILLDNLRHGLHSSELAAALTAKVWSDRLLGGSTMVSLPNRATWMATGNNTDLSLEIARRCVRVRLDTGAERPWSGRHFRHANLPAWVRQSRAALLRAMVVLVKAWLAAGRPAGARSLGSYESWASVVGGILECVGITGFLDNVGALYEAADGETGEWRAFVAAWMRACGDSWTRVGRLVELADEGDLLGGVLGKESTRSKQVRLGKALAQLRDRVFDGMQVEARTNAHTKAAEYRLVAPQDPLPGSVALNLGGRPSLPTEPEGCGTSAGIRDAASRTDHTVGCGDGDDLRDVAGYENDPRPVERDGGVGAGSATAPAGGLAGPEWAPPRADQRGRIGAGDDLRDVAGCSWAPLEDDPSAAAEYAAQETRAAATSEDATRTSRGCPQPPQAADFAHGSSAEIGARMTIRRPAHPAAPAAANDDPMGWEEGLL